MRNEMREGAIHLVPTIARVPATACKSGAGTLPGEGHQSDDNHDGVATTEPTKSGAVKRRGRGRMASENQKGCASHASIEIVGSDAGVAGEGRMMHDHQSWAALTRPYSETVAEREAVDADFARGIKSDMAMLDREGVVSELIGLQRQRRFCITSQSRCDRSVESFIATLIGYSNGADPKERKAVFAQASAFRKKVEKDGEGLHVFDNLARRALSVAVPLIILSANSRAGLDRHRTQVEKRMRQLVRTLPGYALVEAVKGFGDLGAAVIIGETGDLAGYATKERVWKRLGLAVIDGQRQGRRTNAEEAAKHGYNPKRRSEVWNVGDSLLRAQWRGARDNASAHPIGPYGEIYQARKAHTATREGWTPAHRDNDARRVMTKALVEALWKAWRQSDANALN